MFNPIYDTVTRIIPRQHPSLLRQDSGKVQIDISLLIRPLPSHALAVICPGYDTSYDGQNGQSHFLAKAILERKIAAVIQMPNRLRRGLNYALSILDDLRAVIEYAVSNSRSICGCPEPELYLIGISAGAGAVAAVCSDNPIVKKIVLIVPAGDVGSNAIKGGLERFEGQSRLIFAIHDRLVNQETRNFFFRWLIKSPKNALYYNTDHNFSGDDGIQYLHKGILWALLDESVELHKTG